MAPAPPISLTPDAGGTPVDPEPIVARYDGVLSLSMERSQFVVVDEEGSRTSRARFASAPGFSKTAAPPSTATIRDLLIIRLLAVLDFGAGLSVSTLSELEVAIEKRWSAVARLRQERAAGRATAAYERIAVEGLVRIDGTAEWGYTYGAGGRPLPMPMPTEIAATTERIAPRSEYELYIQNQMRADLMRTLSLP